MILYNIEKRDKGSMTSHLREFVLLHVKWASNAKKIITLKKNHGLKQTTLKGFVEIVLRVVPRRLPFHLVGDGNQLV